MSIKSTHPSYNSHALDLATSLPIKQTSPESSNTQPHTQPANNTSENIAALDLAEHFKEPKDSADFLNQRNISISDSSIWNEILKLSETRDTVNKKLVGGKPDNFCIAGPYCIKRPSTNEFNFYIDNLEKLKKHQNYCPKIHSVFEFMGEKILIMEDLTSQFENHFQIDIKIGKSFENEFFLVSQKKKKTHEIDSLIAYRHKKNVRTGAENNHFSIANFSGREKPEKKDTHLYEKEAIDLLSSEKIPALARQKIIIDIENIVSIEKEIFDEESTVVASSILLIIDKDTPENSIARRIDFGNYWKEDTNDSKQSKAGIKQSNEENLKGIESLSNILSAQ